MPGYPLSRVRFRAFSDTQLSYDEIIVARNDLAAYWPCDDASGSLQDLGPGGYDMPASGSPGYLSAAPPGGDASVLCTISNDGTYGGGTVQNRFRLTGLSDPLIEFDNGTPEPFSYVLWMRPNSGNAFQTAYAVDNGIVVSSHVRLRSNNRTDFTRTPTQQATTPLGTELADGTWYMLVCRYDGTVGTIHYWPDTTAKITSAAWTGGFPNVDTVHIGSDGGSGGFWNGSMNVARVAVFSAYVPNSFLDEIYDLATA